MPQVAFSATADGGPVRLTVAPYHSSFQLPPATLPQVQTTTLAATTSAIDVPICGQTGTVYVPDLLWHVPLHLDSADQCLNRCKGVETCKFFSYTVGGLCHLHSEDATSIPSLATDVAGPAWCGMMPPTAAPAPASGGGGGGGFLSRFFGKLPGASRLYSAELGGLWRRATASRGAAVALAAAAVMVVGARAVVGLVLRPEGALEVEEHAFGVVEALTPGWLSRQMSRTSVREHVHAGSRYLPLDPDSVFAESEALA